MKNFSLLTKTYLISTIIIGSYLLIWRAGSIVWEPPRMLMLLVLCLASSLAQIFKVVGSTNRSHYAISFVVYSFALLQLGLPETLIVIAVSNLAEWLWHRAPWFIAAFNCACYMLVMQVAQWVYAGFNPTSSLHTWQSVAAIVLSMSAFTLLNHLMVGIIIWLARGENFAKSGLFAYLPLTIDLTMLVMGASLHLVWNYNPYAVLLFLIPLYLIYSTLRVPALERKTELEPKTGLFNHEYFMQQFESELARADRYDRPLAVIMGDLDLLRSINNTYGHLAGDEVLKGVAKILQESVRDYDVVARFGGEEFVILLPETATPAAYERAEIIRKKIEATDFLISTSVIPVKVTISMGVVGRERPRQTKEEILHNADTAMYHSKLKGRNRTYVYNGGAYLELIHAIDENRSAMEKAGTPGGFSAEPEMADAAVPGDSAPGYAAAYATYQTARSMNGAGNGPAEGQPARKGGPPAERGKPGQPAGFCRLKTILLMIFRSFLHHG